MLDDDPLQGNQVRLRKFILADAPAVQALAGDPAIADTTLNVPHPYPDGAAEQWIASHESQFQQGTAAIYAIITLTDQALVGSIGVGIHSVHRRGQIGYWIGRPYWNRGYCTEALRLLLGDCFSRLNLHRVYASHFARNPASGRVMQKVGMQREGLQREHVWKDGRFEDSVLYGLLRSDYQSPS